MGLYTRMNGLIYNYYGEVGKYFAGEKDNVGAYNDMRARGI